MEALPKRGATRLAFVIVGLPSARAWDEHRRRGSFFIAHGSASKAEDGTDLSRR
jgi:hypothetical protein